MDNNMPIPETVSEVTDFIGGTLLPQIEELQTDVLVL